MRKILLFLIILQTIKNADDIYSINDFKRSYFKIISQNNGFYKINSKIETAVNELPITYGFVDLDFYTDIISVTSDFKQAVIYLFNEEDGTFEKSMTTPVLSGDETIISAKITYVTSASSYPNILIVSQSNSNNKMLIHAFQINIDTNNKYTIIEIPQLLVSVDRGSAAVSVEPISFQISNDTGMTEYWLTTDAGVRTLISYDRSKSTPTVTKTTFASILDAACAGCIDFNSVLGFALAPAGSHAFADLNGDGRADLVLESTDASSGNRYLEFYAFQNTGKFGLSKQVPINAHYSVGTWVDLQERKIMDIVFWNKNDNKLYIHSGMVSSGTAITGDNQFNSDGYGYSIPSLENPSSNLPLVLDLIPGAKIQESPALRIFGLIRFADLNLDGYMDLLVNTIDANGSNNVHAFPSVPCANLDKNPTCRTFLTEFDPYSIGIIQNKKTVQTSLFDFGERGSSKKQDRSALTRIMV